MLVYRVEMEDGIGPYQSPILGNFGWTMGIKHTHDPKHPGPATDFDGLMYGRNEPDYFFGFDSMNKLFKWFAGFLPYIIKNGGKIVKYEVDNEHVVYGRSRLQLAFNKEAARKC